MQVSQPNRKVDCDPSCDGQTDEPMTAWLFDQAEGHGPPPATPPDIETPAEGAPFPPAATVTVTG